MWLILMEIIPEKNWKFSETYMYKNQRKNIISDKYTRSYNSANKHKKKILL